MLVVDYLIWIGFIITGYMMVNVIYYKIKNDKK